MKEMRRSEARLRRAAAPPRPTDHDPDIAGMVRRTAGAARLAARVLRGRAERPRRRPSSRSRRTSSGSAAARRLRGARIRFRAYVRRFPAHSRSAGRPGSSFACIDSQHVHQRGARLAGHDGRDHPAHQQRYGPAQREDLAFHQHAAGNLLVAPVHVQPPQEAAVVADGLLPLVRRPEVLQLGDPRRLASAPGPPAARAHVLRHVLGVVVHGDDGLPAQLEKRPQLVAVAPEDARLDARRSAARAAESHTADRRPRGSRRRSESGRRPASGESCPSARRSTRRRPSRVSARQMTGRPSQGLAAHGLRIGVEVQHEEPARRFRSPGRCGARWPRRTAVQAASVSSFNSAAWTSCGASRPRGREPAPRAAAGRLGGRGRAGELFIVRFSSSGVRSHERAKGRDDRSVHETRGGQIARKIQPVEHDVPPPSYSRTGGGCQNMVAYGVNTTFVATATRRTRR